MKVVDRLLERIQQDLELNQPQTRQRRITLIALFAEVYNWQVISTELFFQVLYNLLEYGHEADRRAEAALAVDGPEDNFRVYLVCVLLAQARQTLTAKSLQRPRVRFLLKFQDYLLGKAYVPMFLEFMVLDVMDALAPRLTKFKTKEQVREALAEGAENAFLQENDPPPRKSEKQQLFKVYTQVPKKPAPADAPAAKPEVEQEAAFVAGRKETLWTEQLD